MIMIIVTAAVMASAAFLWPTIVKLVVGFLSVGYYRAGSRLLNIATINNKIALQLQNEAYRVRI